jgi:hypothetical protein
MPIKTARAFPDALLTQFRQQGDPPADAVIVAVLEAGDSATHPHARLGQFMHWLADTSTFDTADQLPDVQRFFIENATLPAWADRARMQGGMAFFKKHAGPIGLILGTYSLPYSYLGADGAQVLWLTERIKTDTSRRLLETGEWVFGITNPAEWTSGQAVQRTLKIRLIHAAARWFAAHSSRWQTEWGTPVNQEDMAGTNLAFSYIVIDGLRKSGIAATEAEEEDYLHHLNVVSKVLGVDERLIPQNLREAYRLGTAIARRQFKPSEAGRGLTKSLLDAVAKQAESTLGYDTARNLVAGEMRFFMGDEYANWLGVPDAPVVKRLASVVNRLPIFPAFPVSAINL